MCAQYLWKYGSAEVSAFRASNLSLHTTSWPLRHHYRRHLKQSHLLATQGPQCGRCKRCFQTSEDFEEHCEQAIACEPRTGHDDLQDPEEGLSAKKYISLTKRSKDEKVNQWDAVWGVLFPTDVDVPRPRK